MSNTFGRPAPTIRLWPIAIIRIYAGIFFLNAGIATVNSGGAFTDSMVGFLNSQQDTYEWYQGFIASVVLPNKAIFAALVAWGEVALGVALILGLATRYAAFAGAFLVANFWFAKGLPFLSGYNHDSLWMMLLLMLAFIPAGRVLGLDARLSDNFAFLR